MFSFIRRRFTAARTLAALCQAAEAEARRDGQAEPGVEHFVLAALSLPDGKALQVFEALGATDALLRQAIAYQYQAPLHALGIDRGLASQSLGEAGKSRLYRAAPSGQALIQALGRERGQVLTSDKVLVAATEQSEGVLPRALAAMGFSLDQLRAVALAT